MRKTLMILLSTAAIGTLPMIQSCKKCKDDPCKSQVAADASFDVIEELGDMEFKTDTILSSCIAKVHFRAKNEADSFIWTLGSETIYTKEFWRSCGWPEDDFITVKLITIKDAAKNPCLEKHQLRDTSIQKIFVIKMDNPNYIFNGQFLGANTDVPDDTFRFTIQNQYPLWEGLPKGLLVKNFRPGTNFTFNTVHGGEYVRFMKARQGAAYALSCKGYIKKVNTMDIEIHYQYDENALQRYYDGKDISEWKQDPIKLVNKVWKGRKVK